MSYRAADRQKFSYLGSKPDGARLSAEDSRLFEEILASPHITPAEKIALRTKFSKVKVQWMSNPLKIALAIFAAIVALPILAALVDRNQSNTVAADVSPRPVVTLDPALIRTQTPEPTATDDPGDQATDAPTPKPAPTARPETYEHQRQREKHEFYETIDQTVTATKIAGNPTKYEGEHVELHCVVSNVPQEGMINASCGDDGTNIVLQYGDTASVDQGQSVRVLGEVTEPMEGTNAMGGSMNFPSVKVEFME